MKLSVLIPTYRRPLAINRCLADLSTQPCDFPFEIIVGLDGPEDTTPDPIIPPAIESRVRLARMDHIGLIAVRKNMLELATGQTVLWLNDDVRPAPRLLMAHIEAHRDHSPCVVAGLAQWKPVEHPDLFDLLVERTDLIFFQQPSTLTLATTTTYRNCFGLNMSFPRELANEIGGLHDLSESYGYEDIELAYRLNQGCAQIWHVPSAQVIHDHRYRPGDVCRREYLLGRSAWQYANLNPDFAMDVFKRDLCSSGVLDYFAAALSYELNDAKRIERSFRSLAGTDVDIHNPPEQGLLDMLAEHWVVLKRFLWRWGVLDGANGVQVDAALEHPVNAARCPYS